MAETIEFTVDGREFWVNHKRFWFEDWNGETRWGTVKVNRMGCYYTYYGEPFPTPAEAQQSAINYVMEQKGKTDGQ